MIQFYAKKLETKVLLDEKCVEVHYRGWVRMFVISSYFNKMLK